jgi:hypothetical protein
MARQLNRLSSLAVQRAKKPGMYADGAGLYLRVAPGGSRQWIFRYVTHGRMRDLGIGPAHTLSLAEARERAVDARKLRLDGIARSRRNTSVGPSTRPRRPSRSHSGRAAPAFSRPTIPGGQIQSTGGSGRARSRSYSLRSGTSL